MGQGGTEHVHHMQIALIEDGQLVILQVDDHAGCPCRLKEEGDLVNDASTLQVAFVEKFVLKPLQVDIDRAFVDVVETVAVVGYPFSLIIVNS